MINKADELYVRLAQAKRYLSMIGKYQPHLTDTGKLTSLEVKTQIHYQEHPGSSNYHGDVAFDAALAKVIQSRFNELKEAAIKIMEDNAKAALLKEEEALLARLERIKKIKEEQ